ncbi:hypothetical protein LCGC14_0848500, partial [marine sediment metagenome]
MATTYTIDFTDIVAKPSFAIAPFTTDGPVSPNDPTLDSAASAANTSLLLHGKGVPDYGERINENLIHLLENFSSDVEPVFPTTGQLWYDTAVTTLRIFNGTAFISLDTVIISDTPPADGVAGQLWLDTSVPQLKVCFGGTTAVPFVITAVTLGASGTFGIAGDQTSFFTSPEDFSVTGSTGNDANYVVASSSFGAGTTTITVVGIIPDGTVDGDICIWLATADQFVLKAGDTMTGFLFLNADPTLALHAATKQYVDVLAAGQNELVEMLDVSLSGPPPALGSFLKVTSGVTPFWSDELIILTDVTDVTASAAEVNFLVGTTSSVQTQLDARVFTSGDSMDAGADLSFSIGGEVLGLPAVPSVDDAAASKKYVDDQIIAGGADGVLTNGTWDDVGKILTLTTSAPSVINVDQSHNHEALDLDYTILGSRALDAYFQPAALPTLGVGVAGQYAIDGLDLLKANRTLPQFNNQLSLTTTFTISAVSAGASGTFTIDSGDVTSVLVSGFQFNVEGSTGNNNTYIAASSATGAGFAGTQAINLANGAFDYKAAGTFFPTAELTNITCPAASAFVQGGAAPGSFWRIASTTTLHYVWYDVTDVGGNTDPADPGRTGITVAVLAADIDSVVATKTAAALNLVGGTPFTASPVGALVSNANNSGGNVEDAADVNSTVIIAIILQGIGVVLTTPTGLANDATVFTATVVIDGGPDGVAVTGNAVQTVGTLITQIDLDLTGGTTSLVEGNLVITSSTSGVGSTVAITEIDLFTSLADFAFFRDPIDGDDTTVVTITGTVPDSTADGVLFWDTVPVTIDNVATKNYADARTTIGRNHFTTTGPTTVFTATEGVPTYDVGSDRLWVFISGIKQIRSFEEVTEIDFSSHTIIAADHWTLDAAPTPDAHYVWYTVDAGGADPTPGGTGILVAILSADTPDEVATKTATAMDGFGGVFAATSIGGTPIVTVTNVATG